MKLTIPTAIVVVAFLGLYGFLEYKGLPIPLWLAGAGTLVASLMAALLRFGSSASSSGGGSGSASPSSSSSSSGGQPPFAARLAYRFALCLALLFLCGRFLLACTNGVPSPATVQNVTIGLNAAVCVLDTYSKDMAAGKGDVTAIADCVIRCGVTAAQATGLLDAHRKAEVLETAKTSSLDPDPAEDARKALQLLEREGPPWYLEAMARARQAAATPSSP